MNHLYICSPDEKQYTTLIKASNLPNLQLVDDISKANIILGEPPLAASLIEKATKLKWMQSTFAGCDKLIAAKKREYQLTNVRGIFGALMSEYVFGYLISLERHFSYYQKMQRQQTWSSSLPYQSLSEKKNDNFRDRLDRSAYCKHCQAFWYAHYGCQFKR